MSSATTSGTAPSSRRIGQMIALRTSASSGAMTSSLSVSVLDGAICSSGISWLVAGSRYCTKLWCDNSASSSIRMPVWRRTSTAAQVQNELVLFEGEVAAPAGGRVLGPHLCAAAVPGHHRPAQRLPGGGELLSRGGGLRGQQDLGGLAPGGAA